MTSSGAAIQLDRIRKSFGATMVVPELTLEVPAGSLTALLGPSGGRKPIDQSWWW